MFGRRTVTRRATAGPHAGGLQGKREAQPDCYLAHRGARQRADRMGVTKGRVSQIAQGQVSGQEVLARYAVALGGRLHQAIHFEDGDSTAIA
ncbi:transcriptional regulator [Dactylosporangium sp. NPDC051541]|uniref:transcriptional regulator n=1 Tax=Dactylosporangium sp. NPDC051541 TaxID=3363977 RepID=UPI0037945103